MSSRRNPSTAPHPPAFGAVAASRIRARLRSADALLSRGTLADARRLRDLLEDAAAASEAFELVLATTAGAPDPPAAPGAPMARLACDVLRGLTGGEPVTSFRLIPFGAVRIERPVAGGSFDFERPHAEAVVAWFEALDRKLAIDYEHQSFDRFNARDDGLRPAAGWIGGLEVRDDGLWATDVTWTERAAALLRSGEYRYFSPVIYWRDDEYREIAGLGPVALTNDPAMHGVAPLTTAASRAAEEDADAGGASADGAPPDHSNTTERLAAAERQISALRRLVEEQRADAFVERGLRSGRIVEATRTDWRGDYLRDPAAAEQRLTRAPVLLHTGRLSKPPSERPVEAPGPAGEGRPEPADLDAFERARSAGRILPAGGTRL